MIKDKYGITRTSKSADYREQWTIQNDLPTHKQGQVTFTGSCIFNLYPVPYDIISLDVFIALLALCNLHNVSSTGRNSESHLYK